MQVGSLITLTKEDFIRLAPLGLRVHYCGTTYYYHKNPRTDDLWGDAIKGYVFGYFNPLEQYDHIHLRGFWSRFNGTNEFKVITPPITTLYKRSSCE